MPCNNDLLAANFVDDGRRGRLIDYEYSGTGDACFELGNTSTECGFTPEQTEAWTAAYFGDPTPADLARVRVQALCSEYGWSLWASSRPPPARSTSTSTAGGRSATRRRPRPSAARISRDCWRRWSPVAELPSRARVVIVGGGVIGTSVAYHLPRLGWTDVLLLEQGRLSGGTTRHAAGLVGPLRASEGGTRLVQYSAELYAAARGRERAWATATATSAA